jgi:RNA ligase (TIGR02306 family)
VYFEIDSLLPNEHPAFEFMSKGSRVVTIALEDGGTASGYRLKTVRLRGQISQGLALPVHAALGFAVGSDVSAILGVHKWEPPISKQMASIARGPFPAFIPKTDEERVQNLGDVVARHAGELFCVTEKLDGMSATFYRTKDAFGVCSRNLDLKDGGTYWSAARDYGLDEKLPVGFAVQGEIIGEAIQGNPLKRKGHGLYVFNVYDFTEGQYLNPSAMLLFCNRIGLETVPIVHASIPLPGSVSDIVEMAEGNSLLNPGCDREGLVFRPLREQREEMRGLQSRLSFKAISNAYLLRN